MLRKTANRSRLLLLMTALLSSVASALLASPPVNTARLDSVMAIAAESAVTFESDVQPLLTRFGCNAGQCHGKSGGQNGFALSLLGFDADFDHHALLRAGRGRRVFPAAPEMSLLLQKASGQIPHGGGVRFDVDSWPYKLLHAWIQAGSPRTPANAPKLIRIVIEPASQILAPQESFPLRVLAVYSDGSHREVTDTSTFQSNESTITAVSPDGMLQAGPVPGEAAIMVRYMNHIAVCAVTIPLTGNVPDEVYERLPRDHEIDVRVWDKLKRLRMLPSALTNDATFHRRAYLRAIGRLPTPEETRAFLSDSDSDKRRVLVGRLLDRPEYADFWANKWADLLRPNPYRAGIKAVWMLDAWLRDALRKNKPYDQFVRELVTAQGSTWHNGATVIFRDRPWPAEIGASVSQLFLGVRLECAKCHHHPFEIWSQDDFYGFAAFFARVRRDGGGLSPPISGGEQFITSASIDSAQPVYQVKHARTGAVVAPKTLTGSPLTLGPEVDPREVLVDWMTQADNAHFAKVMANRVWAEIMGRGLVEPVDDLRATNPASNEPLLEYLAHDFREHDYDVKHLIRTIMTSRVFGLSSTPVERNVSDLKNFSRYYRQRLRAEVLLDAVNDVLETQEEFSAMPPGSRATQLWTHRASSLFLDTFGRPDPNKDPPCDRTWDSTTPQILHLMNSPKLNSKMALDSARPAKLALSEASNENIVEEAFFLVFCRPPTNDEAQKALAILPEGEPRRTAVEDLFWALLNTPEFLFID